MKNFFLAIIAVLFALTCSADAADNVNLVRVSDFNPKEFIDRMGTGVVYQTFRQSGKLVAFTQLKNRPQFYDAENFPGMNVVGTVFGVEGDPLPDGEVRFFVDTEGNVFVVQFISSDIGNAKTSGMVLLMVMEALGLNENEVDALINRQSPTTEVFCANTKRRIIRQISDREGRVITFFGATNSKL